MSIREQVEQLLRTTGQTMTDQQKELAITALESVEPYEPAPKPRERLQYTTLGDIVEFQEANI